MTTTTHIERTASAPRQSNLHTVTISRIRRVSPTIRLLTLALPYAVKFLPGQWVDLHIPSLPSPGGFTITSSPSLATTDEPVLLDTERHAFSEGNNTSTSFLARLNRHSSPSQREESTSPQVASPVPVPRPFIELAVQQTSNKPAQWLWRPAEEILGSQLGVRIGGSFVWPPAGVIDVKKIRKVVFIAGGVGINPFMSMLSSMYEHRDILLKEIEFLYSTKAPSSGLSEVLFLQRLVQLFENGEFKSLNRRLRLHLTGQLDPSIELLIRERVSDVVELRAGRISSENIAAAIGGDQDRSNVVAYVCGPKSQVDDTVKQIQNLLGQNRVFSEKWW